MIAIIIFLASLFNPLQTSEVSEIEFGSGGGFTGTIKSYLLKSNGELYEVNAFQETRSLLKNIDIETTTSLFQDLERYELQHYSYKKPGNIYKFIHFKMKDRNHRIVWTGKSENKNLNLFYADLKALCKPNE